MRVTLNCTYCHAKGTASPGDVMDIANKDAQDLVDAGLATKVIARSKSTDSATGQPEAGGADDPQADGNMAGAGELGSQP